TRRVLAELQGTPWLVANLLYGGGLRLQEALMLRVKDLDLERLELVVAEIPRLLSILGRMAALPSSC
ncbi:MAG: hypothetical protein H7A16_10070, partial [Sinobacteraceae bacterium]|nr:hypothetical protein [Nevskiaceae bacterium]